MKKVIFFSIIAILFYSNCFSQLDNQGRFHYINDRGEKLMAKPEAAYTTFGKAFTHDPEYLIYNSQGIQIGHSEWLTVLGTDGIIWITKIHAEYQHGDNYIKIWVESKKRDDNSAVNTSLGIVDWNYHKQGLIITPRVGENQAPSFTMIDQGIFDPSKTTPQITPPKKEPGDYKGRN